MASFEAGLQRLRVGGEDIEFSDRGSGDALLLVHAGVFSGWFDPLVATSELDGFRVIRMRRAGYVPGSSPSGHLTLSDHSAHCAFLLDELGVQSAHVCGHSSSALIGLQLALDRPDLVQSLILLEPAPGGDLNGPVCQAVAPEAIGPAMAAFASGDTATGFDRFMRAVGGDHYREVLDAALGPDGHREAIRESAFFPDEASAVQEWRFGSDEAQRIAAPLLVVEGAQTAKVATIPPESVGLLARLVSHAETAVLEGTSHLMPLEDPRGVGRLVADFARRNPVNES